MIVSLSVSPLEELVALGSENPITRAPRRLAAVSKLKLNIIRDYEVVEKKEVKMPDELRGIVKCANPKCITNNEPMATIFHVIDKDNCIVKCHYCEKEQKREEITIL